MTKLPLFLETAKSYPNKILAYVRTGIVLSDLISYILFIFQKFFNEKYPLIINLLESVILTLTVRTPLTGGANKKASGSRTMICVPENTRLFQLNGHNSKGHFITIPVQIFHLWYNYSHNKLLKSTYTPFLKFKHPHYCLIESVSPYLGNPFLNKNHTTLTGRCNFTI
jgi:hypothetical protein